ncbi:MAG TPA: D-alanine--D-alanine ligase, partial [Alphaproteobacteria bacterium]|nr:D-alanine--D-alanine ligase [Alphaproteobacteria bacterium]
RPVLVQEFLSGREFSVGVIGNPGIGFTLLPILEVDYSRLPEGLPQILGYESKWDPASPYWTNIQYREADIDEELRRNLIDWSTALFERLNCRDYARFDFRADAAGEVKLLEVNPNPGWCWDGKLNLMAGFGGYGYADLLRMIIDAAQRRTAMMGNGQQAALAAQQAG